MKLALLQGRTTRDIELKYSEEGKAYCRFTIAENDKNGASYFDCTAFGKQAETIAQYVHKGNMITVLGDINIDTYEKDGAKLKSWKITVNRFWFSEPKKTEPASNEEGFLPDSLNEEGIPFI